MIDFLIVFKVMSAYVRTRGLDTGRIQKTLETCREVGHSDPVPALLQAQTLAMRFWANAGLLLLLPILVIGGLLALIRPGRVGDNDTVLYWLAKYRDQLAESRRIVANRDLDTPCAYSENSDTNLRWVLMHHIEEVARHAGHADIIRETIDGSTGE